VASGVRYSLIVFIAILQVGTIILSLGFDAFDPWIDQGIENLTLIGWIGLAILNSWLDTC